jgi:hypothetical protein
MVGQVFLYLIIGKAEKQARALPQFIRSLSYNFRKFRLRFSETSAFPLCYDTATADEEPRQQKEAAPMSTIQNSFQRVEQKYLLTGEQYGALRRGMAPYVKPDVYSHYTICSIYCDTEDFAIVRNSLDKPVYKEKLRLRSYGVPGSRDTAFVELKKKFDGVVYKRRVTVTAAQAAECVCTGRLRRDDQISREINWFLHSWQPAPAAYIGYDREAWSGIEDNDLRITVDTNLRARDWDLDLRAGDFGELILPSECILMELKFTGGAPMWLARLLSENGVRHASFSKYGTYYKVLMGQAPTYGNYWQEVRHYA